MGALVSSTALIMNYYLRMRRSMENLESDHNIETRSIYEKQHDRIVANQDAFNRINNLYINNTFGLPSDWFKGKAGLDIGCGNIGPLIIRLVQLGMKKVSGVDVGQVWIPKMKASLQKNGISEDLYDLREGSVLDLPCENESMDFVVINGVLIHLKDMGDIVRGFSEGARVCKKGGYYYTSYGPCGGLMQGVILPAIRAHYNADPDFKRFIDTIDPQDLGKAFDKIVTDALHHTGEDLNASFLKTMFGEDFCVFVQNFVQAPTWLSNECTPKFVENLYHSQGFSDVVRINSFAKRSDIRKYFAPLHFDYEYPLSRILYGEGYVQYIGRKN